VSDPLQEQQHACIWEKRVRDEKLGQRKKEVIDLIIPDL
jgi:hypothetical protein